MSHGEDVSSWDACAHGNGSDAASILVPKHAVEVAARAWIVHAQTGGVTLQGGEVPSRGAEVSGQTAEADLHTAQAREHSVF